MKPITRWQSDESEHPCWVDKDGEWVDYTDHLAAVESAVESARAQDRERIEALEAQNEAREWLIQVERFWYEHPANGSCWWDANCARLAGPKSAPAAWDREREAVAEAKAIWQAARAAAGV